MTFERGALSLLASYGDDSSDDDVPGCRVSTKRTHKDSEELPSNPAFKKFRLPLPDIISKNAINAETPIDDPLQHEGRIRSFAHERGNWATYIYIPYETNLGIEDLIKQIIDTSNIDLKLIDHYHISVTKTVILRHHWIESFMQTIRENMSHVRSFLVMFDSLQVYCNEERTRTFLGIQIKSGYDSLLNIVKIMDNCLSEFTLPHFYKDPSFHMSILWCNGDQEDVLNSILPKLNQYFLDNMNNFSEDNWYIYVNSLQCKTGNKLFNFSLL